MKIVWDEPKREVNLAKHELDFADFEAAFGRDDFVTIPARRSTKTGRPRAQLVGRMHGLMVVAVISPLGSEALALISLRPAGVKERMLHAER